MKCWNFQQAHLDPADERNVEVGSVGRECECSVETVG